MDSIGHLVSVMDPEERRQLTEACREHDRLMAEDAEWMARRQAPMHETVPAGVLCRDYGGGALARALPPAAEPSDGNGIFGDWRDDQLARAIGFALCETRRELREERDAELVKRDRRIAELEGEIRELKGFVGGVLTLLGKSQNFLDSKDASNLKAADDTPRIRKVHDAA